MIRNYFRVIHITVDKIIIGNSQPAHDVPRKSPEGFRKVLTSGMYKNSGDSQGEQYKNWWFYVKKIFQK